MNKRLIILLILILLSSFFLTGCKVTLEQGDLLEKNNKTTEAGNLYWEIVKGDATSYSYETKQEAKKRIIRLNSQSIIPELKTEILSNKDSNSKTLMCDLIIALNSTPNHKCIALAGLAEKTNLDAKKHYASALSSIASEETTTMMISLYSEAQANYQNDLKEQKSKGVTVNLYSNNLLSYYQLVALYNQPKTLDFLLSILVSKDVIDRPGLISALSLVDDPKIIDSILSISKTLSASEKDVVTKLFLNSNDPRTFTFLIGQAVTSTTNEKTIIEKLEKSITASNIKYFSATFQEHNFQLNNKAVIIAKSLIKSVPSKEAVSALTQLLQLKDVTKNETTYAEIQDILAFINKHMTKDNLTDLLLALNKNLSIKSTSDYYALDELLQQNINIINKFYDTNSYLQSFMLELKTLASVYKAKEKFASSIYKARASTELTTVKLLLEEIVELTAVITSNQPASKLLTNVKFFASKIEDAELKKILTSIIKDSNYEKNISNDESLDTLSIPNAIKLTPSTDIIDANE